MATAEILSFAAFKADHTRFCLGSQLLATTAVLQRHPWQAKADPGGLHVPALRFQSNPESPWRAKVQLLFLPKTTFDLPVDAGWQKRSRRYAGCTASTSLVVGGWDRHARRGPVAALPEGLKHSEEG